MKKFTLLALLFACSLNAQTYCPISEDYAGIYEITLVSFGTTTMTNANASSIYINNIATVANVTAGESYTITVKGKTWDGPEPEFEDEYVAYIDWNHNGTLNDAGEIFYIGLIENSTGTDAASASNSIIIPAEALAGNTRIRIMKINTSVFHNYGYYYDPCAIYAEDLLLGGTVPSFGQGLDFTLNVTTLNREAFDKNSFIIYPNPVSSVLNIKAEQNIDAVLVYNLQGQLVLESKNTDKIDVESLAAGQYLIKIGSGELLQVKKFVKH